MNGIQGNKAQNMEKQFPGCLGRMVNLLDLSNGASGNRLLTDKLHGDDVFFVFLSYFFSRKRNKLLELSVDMRIVA